MSKKFANIGLAKVVANQLMKKAGKKFTTREIAELIYKNYESECRKKQASSDAEYIQIGGKDALIGQLIREIGGRLKVLQNDHGIETVEDRPRKWFFPVPSNGTESSEIISTTEHDLYPVLSRFLLSELNIYTKRINEKRAQNKKGPGGNKWLYPDIVGLEDLSIDWDRETKDSVREQSGVLAKLWSFEVKLEINRSIVREAFFQCVSNSSWANFGYLVSGNIEGTDTLKELRMLSSLHNIGFIRLNAENPPESEIVIPAKERPQIDWNIANRLVKENKDFREYIKLVRKFYQTGDVTKPEWDGMEESDWE